MEPRIRSWSFHWEKSGSRAVVEFAEKELRLNDEGVRSLTEELSRLGCEELWLDLHQVEVVNSSTLVMLLKLRKRLLAMGRRLSLFSPGPRLAEILAVTRLDRLFDIRQEPAAVCSSATPPAD